MVNCQERDNMHFEFSSHLIKATSKGFWLTGRHTDSQTKLIIIETKYLASKIPTEKKSTRRQNLRFRPRSQRYLCLRLDLFTCLWRNLFFVYEYDILSTSQYVFESVCLRVDHFPFNAHRYASLYLCTVVYVFGYISNSNTIGVYNQDLTSFFQMFFFS